MGQRLQISWPRVLVAAAAIVASILLAFWIDAWWEEAQDREREVIILGALLDDLQYMRQQVDDQRLYNEGILKTEIASKVDHSGLLSNREFLGLLAAKIDIQQDIINYSLDSLDEDLDKVIRLLRRNLGEEPPRDNSP